MCGICALIHYTDCDSAVDWDELSLLKRRGPDCQHRVVSTLTSDTTAYFYGSVLHFRGSPTQQPIINGGNLLLWNGEIFGGFQQLPDSQNDGQFLCDELGCRETECDILELFSRIYGPWAFIYWQESQKKLWFGRDVFGRRSLLWHRLPSGAVHALSSVQIKQFSSWSEVPAAGLYCLNVGSSLCNDASAGNLILFPWIEATTSSTNNVIRLSTGVQLFNAERIRQLLGEFTDLTVSEYGMKCKVPSVSAQTTCSPGCCDCLPASSRLADDSFLPLDGDLCKFTMKHHIEASDQLLTLLSEAVKIRVLRQDVRCHCCHAEQQFDITKNQSCCTPCGHSRVAILYSGGVDSLLLAALADRHVIADEPIDLLNVAFQGNSKHSSILGKEYDVPDRLTGKQGLIELQALNPHRHWNFVEINVSLAELKYERQTHISSLIHPLNSVLDDSIGCAIWFAARGQGLLADQPYTTTARVLLVGMGADEQLAGYSRHRVRYNNEGWPGLVDEIAMELERISFRNLGRDDRIITDHGREARLPYLDEHVVSYLCSLPMHIKADLSLPRGIGEKFLLRLTAYRLGLVKGALLPKRAIQFGSRIAKAENNHERASDVCSRLQ